MKTLYLVLVLNRLYVLSTSSLVCLSNRMIVFIISYSFFIISLFKKKLFERQSYTERKILHLSWFSPQMAAVQASSVFQVSQQSDRGPSSWISSAAFPGAFAGSWVSSEAATTRTSTHLQCQHHHTPQFLLFNFLNLVSIHVYIFLNLTIPI